MVNVALVDVGNWGPNHLRNFRRVDETQVSIICENALVGAGEVVTEDVEAGTVVVGNPARVIKNISKLSY